MYTHFTVKGDLEYDEGIQFARELTTLMKKYKLEGEFGLSNKVK